MADIVIRGIEIPTNRDVTIRIDPNGEVYVYDTYPTLLLRAITLPKGHGRLIDADALMEIIRAHDYPLTAHFNSTDNGMFTLGIQQAVDETPTIVPAEGDMEDS